MARRSDRHPSPQQIWDELSAAQRSLTGNGAPTHEPRAAVLCCSDARVPPELVFDQPAGSLFVVRVAGNTASPVTIASLDFAVGHLGVELVVVMGHTDCGAARGAVSGGHSWPLEPVVAPLRELAEADPEASVDDIVARNVGRTLATLAAHRGPTGRGVQRGTAELRGVVYDLRSGALTGVPVPGSPAPP